MKKVIAIILANETTIKFIRDKDGKTYYLSAGTLMYIIEETETEGEK